MLKIIHNKYAKVVLSKLQRKCLKSVDMKHSILSIFKFLAKKITYHDLLVIEYQNIKNKKWKCKLVRQWMNLSFLFTSREANRNQRSNTSHWRHSRPYFQRIRNVWHPCRLVVWLHKRMGNTKVHGDDGASLATTFRGELAACLGQ